jgi:hypothetical protein
MGMSAEYTHCYEVVKQNRARSGNDSGRRTVDYSSACSTVPWTVTVRVSRSSCLFVWLEGSTSPGTRWPHSYANLDAEGSMARALTAPETVYFSPLRLVVLGRIREVCHAESLTPTPCRSGRKHFAPFTPQPLLAVDFRESRPWHF